MSPCLGIVVCPSIFLSRESSPSPSPAHRVGLALCLRLFSLSSIRASWGEHKVWQDAGSHRAGLADWGQTVCVSLSRRV